MLLVLKYANRQPSHHPVFNWLQYAVSNQKLDSGKARLHGRSCNVVQLSRQKVDGQTCRKSENELCGKFYLKMAYRSLQLPRLQLPVQSHSIAAKSPIFCLQTQILSWDPEKEGILLVHMGPAVDTGSHHVLSDHHHRKLVLCGVDVQFHECHKLLHKVL